MNKPTIIIPIALGFTIRNILRSDLFALLKNRFNVVLLSKIKDPSFIKEFASESVTLADFPNYKPSKIQKIFMTIADYSFNEHNKFAFHNYLKKTREVAVHKKTIKYFVNHLIFIFGNFVWYFARSFATIMIKNTYYSKLLQKHKPTIVFSTLPHFPDEQPLIKEAQRKGIKTIALIHSWDNLSTKGLLFSKYDKYLVWNEIIKDELLSFYKIYGIKETDIEIVGVPQHDYFVTAKNTLKGKELFLKEYGFVNNFKILLYTTAPASLTPHEDIILNDLLNIIKGGGFENTIAIIRVHPKDDINRYRFIPSFNRFIIEPPGKFCKDVDDQWNPSYQDMIHYAELLYNCDCNINVASTVTLDAMAFDKHIINIAYDGVPTDKNKSILCYYDFNHYKPLTESGLIDIVYSKEELESAIRKALFLGKSTRDFGEIKKRFLYKTDGNSYLRIFRTFEKFL